MQRIYAVYSDFSARQFSDYRSAIKTEPLTVISITKIKKHTSKGNKEYDLHSIEFMSELRQKKTLKLRNWEVVNFDEPKFGSFSNYNDTDFTFWGGIIKCSIKDPNGKIKEERIPDNIDGVIYLVKKFFDISKYESWENYELMQENKTLKENVKNLNEKIRELEKIIKEQFAKKEKTTN